MEKRKYTRITDLIDRNLRRAWQNSRVQALHRGDEYLLTWEDYLQLWRKNDRYLQKGTTLDSLVMVRTDPDGPWSVANTEIMTRQEQLKRQRKIQ